MNRIAGVVLVAALLLVGCKTTSPESLVFATKSRFTAAELSALAHARLPRCGPTTTALCSRQQHVDSLIVAADAGRISINAAEVIVRDKTAGQSAWMKAALAADASLKALLALVPPKEAAP